MIGKLALLGAASLAAFFASGSLGAEEAPTAEGRIFHYVRSNHDGSGAEHVYVYRAAESRIEIYKAVSRCTDAAFVRAWFDPETGRAARMTGGRLMPGGRHEDFATLAYDAEAGMLAVDAALPQGAVEVRERVPEPVWHLYDADLATLSVQTAALADPRAGFSFGLPLVHADSGEDETLEHLGRADARFVGEEQWRGTPALRFEVGGPALGERGGPLWLDAETGHVLAARWGIPNHDGMDDFALRLVDVDGGGEPAWQELLTRHFEGCAAA